MARLSSRIARTSHTWKGTHPPGILKNVVQDSFKARHFNHDRLSIPLLRAPSGSIDKAACEATDGDQRIPDLVSDRVAELAQAAIFSR